MPPRPPAWTRKKGLSHPWSWSAPLSPAPRQARPWRCSPWPGVHVTAVAQLQRQTLATATALLLGARALEEPTACLPVAPCVDSPSTLPTLPTTPAATLDAPPRPPAALTAPASTPDPPPSPSPRLPLPSPGQSSHCAHAPARPRHPPRPARTAPWSTSTPSPCRTCRPRCRCRRSRGPTSSSPCPWSPWSTMTSAPLLTPRRLLGRPARDDHYSPYMLC